MSYVWDKIKGRVDHASTHLKHFSDKDVDEDDTAVSRALQRYYGPTPPQWVPEKKSMIPANVHIPGSNLRITVPGRQGPMRDGPASASSTSLHDILKRNRPGTPARLPPGSPPQADPVSGSQGPNSAYQPRTSGGPPYRPQSPPARTGSAYGVPGTPGRSGLVSKLKTTNW